MIINVSLQNYSAQMAEKGWIVMDSIFEQDFVDSMAADLLSAWDTCSAIQHKNGVANDADLTVHHLVGQKDSFLECIDRMEPLMPYIKDYFGGNFILNSFGGAINTKKHTSYAQRVHRDIRSFSGDMPLMLNTLIMLDEFTEQNGATYMLSGSHKAEEKPSNEEFYAKAERAVGPAGSILIFNSNVWHAGGNNMTEHQRRSVTPMYCKPFIRQQFDYPRAVGYDKTEDLLPHTRQILGYNARVPASLDEWYQPPASRMYKSDQG